jgi:urea transport system permease protein
MFRNDTGFGGNNGMTGFHDIAGLPAGGTAAAVLLAALSTAAVLVCLLAGRALLATRFGRLLTAIRDDEPRLRFLGYETLWLKLAAWCLSAMVAAAAGALYVPQVGIINPGEFAPANSIEAVIWVAVGGRGTLVGAILGAVLVNFGKTYFTGALPELWLFALGGLFIFVTLLLPKGVMGLFAKRDRRKKPESEAAVSAAKEVTG